MAFFLYSNRFLLIFKLLFFLIFSCPVPVSSTLHGFLLITALNIKKKKKNKRKKFNKIKNTHNIKERALRTETFLKRGFLMGDAEFENFLNGNSNENSPLECQKKLLLDIIQQKLNSTVELIGVYSDLHIKFPKYGYDDKITALKKIFDDTLEQLDYLMSVVFDEMDGGKGDGNPDGED
jgi:hypothetical protein